MAITINYITNEILVTRADTTFVQNDPVTGREIRELNMDTFRLAVGDIQDNENDVWAPTAIQNTEAQDLGGFVLGRSVIVLDPYFVTFEDGLYQVNLVGGNTNLKSRTTVNSVSVNPDNSAGLVQVTSGSGVTEQDKIDIANLVLQGKIDANIVEVNDIPVDGDGTDQNPWGPQ